MKLDLELVEQFLRKISESSSRTIQANISQLFSYIENQISSDNLKFKQYESERKKKWNTWRSNNGNWEMPLNIEEARSLSWNLYKKTASDGYDVPLDLYSENFDISIREFNSDFLDHFYQAIQEINNVEIGDDIRTINEVSTDSSIVFVVYGRNEKIRKSMFSFLRSIGLSPLEWNSLLLKTGKASPYIGEILEKAFTMAQAVIVVLTPDDEVKLKDEFISDTDDNNEKNIMGQARPNVLFEGGMAMGRHPERTIFVQIGNVKPFSDIFGRHVIKLNNNTAVRQDLANRLKNAGCNVDLEGTDWHTSGDFIL